MLAFSHNKGHVTANVNAALMGSATAIPDLETLTPSNMKPAVPRKQRPKKRKSPERRIKSRGEVLLNGIRKKSKCKEG